MSRDTDWKDPWFTLAIIFGVGLFFLVLFALDHMESLL